MRTDSGQPYFSNGVMIVAAAAILALIGTYCSQFIVWVGILACIALTVCWALIPKFNIFMDSRIKVFKYLYYDSRNEPMSYALWSLCMVAVVFWGLGQWLQDRYLELDTIYGFTSLYVVFCVMTFVGYYKDYDRLP